MRRASRVLAPVERHAWTQASGVSTMRSPLIILPLAALLACGGGGSDATGPGTTGGTPTGGTTGGTGAGARTAVDMKNLAFAPSAIKVASGATVTWTNQDGVTHNVTFDGAAVPPSGPVDAV